MYIAVFSNKHDISFLHSVLPSDVTGGNLTHRMLTYIYNGIVDTDKCASNPCVNGGICADGIDIFKCTCAAGFMGATCDAGKIILFHSLTTYFRIVNIHKIVNVFFFQIHNL